MKSTLGACGSCGGKGLSLFHEVEATPVYACKLMRSREEALRAPTGVLHLAFCEDCGFIENAAFDARLVDYTESYEDSQSFSPRFREFARGLAERLIGDYGLRHRDLLELGCGKGDFLALLCELGPNRGVGIDPAYQPGRLESEALPRMTFHREFFGPEHRALPADLVLCRHTLEHLPAPREFVRRVRAALDGRRPVVFFEVPDVLRILEEGAFWDVYYEHCSYFTRGSLARLFRSCGFEVLRVETGFADQYLLLDARPAAAPIGEPSAFEDDSARVRQALARFQSQLAESVSRWSGHLAALRERAGRAVLWGAGSKAVGFLATLGAPREIEYVVDINPHKQGAYLPVTAQQIVGPGFLRELRPDLVIVMNPIYRDEIRGLLGEMSLAPEVVAL